ncbi:hypothetical protein ASN18_1373 [Candidatus Magnetominusculus xianensis]|uniref:Uncharacterized protein n=1 Tax=Candidatus Magnetominusculus xianensis TaxID=1748249 RepID=A0ABR5SJX3_9BACT|nr:hypothetical protein ASN18_1373 [Candidatus Magnetominusculus xianensis]
MSAGKTTGLIYLDSNISDLINLTDLSQGFH